MRARSLLAGAAAALLALAASSCRCDISTPSDADRAARFAPHIASWLDASALTDEATEDGGYVKRKVVLVDVAKREAAVGTMTFLPSEIRAYDPEEVGTVVWLEWGEEPGPGYEVRSTGQKVKSMNATCAITVIDREAKKIVGRKKVVSVLKDDVTLVAESVGPGAVIYADRPLADVHEYVAKLPRR